MNPRVVVDLVTAPSERDFDAEANLARYMVTYTDFVNRYPLEPTVPTHSSQPPANSDILDIGSSNKDKAQTAITRLVWHSRAIYKAFCYKYNDMPLPPNTFKSRLAELPLLRQQLFSISPAVNHNVVPPPSYVNLAK